jgi:hypothetical protein
MSKPAEETLIASFGALGVVIVAIKQIFKPSG